MASALQGQFRIVVTHCSDPCGASFFPQAWQLPYLHALSSIKLNAAFFLAWSLITVPSFLILCPASSSSFGLLDAPPPREFTSLRPGFLFSLHQGLETRSSSPPRASHLKSQQGGFILFFFFPVRDSTILLCLMFGVLKSVVSSVLSAFGSVRREGVSDPWDVLLVGNRPFPLFGG